jgi:hypothetical protein
MRRFRSSLSCARNSRRSSSATLGVELLLTVELSTALLDVVGGINARFKF